MEFILSEKLKPLTPIDGYTFCFHKMLANDIQRWTCSKSSCKCYLKIDNNKIIESNIDHKHDKIDENISKRQASTRTYLLRTRESTNTRERSWESTHLCMKYLILL